MLIRYRDMLNRRGKAFAIRLTRWTGKHSTGTHPKHLVPAHDAHAWYVNGVRGSGRVLDLGCGTGVHGQRVLARACQVVAMDRHPQVSPRRGVMHVIRGDATAPLPFRDATFDDVLCLDVIEHLIPRIAVLHEIWRILVNDGRLFITWPNRETTWRRRLRAAGLDARHDPDHQVEYAGNEFQRELLAGGFMMRDPPMPIVYDTPWAGVID